MPTATNEKKLNSDLFRKCQAGTGTHAGEGEMNFESEVEEIQDEEKSELIKENRKTTNLARRGLHLFLTFTK